MAEGMSIWVAYDGDAHREDASRFLEAGRLLDHLFRINTAVARALCENEGAIRLQYDGTEGWEIVASSVNLIGRPHGLNEG